MANATSARRAMTLLRLLAAAPGPMSAGTLSREAGLPRSSTYHLLTAMAEDGFVVHYPEDQRWGIGVSAFELGTAYLRHDPLERLGRPLVHRLAQDAGAIVPAVVHLGVLHGRETVYLLREATPVPVTVVVDVGVRLPASLTASGRALLAQLPSAQLRALFPSRDDFVDRTGRGPTSLTSLRRAIAEDVERGWAEEDGFIVEGYASVAAAAVDRSGRPVASIGLTFRSDRASTRDRAALGRAAASVARELSRRLGA